MFLVTESTSRQYSFDTLDDAYAWIGSALQLDPMDVYEILAVDDLTGETVAILTMALPSSVPSSTDARSAR